MELAREGSVGRGSSGEEGAVSGDHGGGRARTGVRGVNGAALVVGGSSGIGRSCVEALAAAGWPTVVADLKPAPGEEAIALDVRDREAVFTAVGQAATAHDGLGAVVYAAGTARVKPLLEVEEREWELVLGVNLSGAFHVLQAAAP